MKLKSDQLRIKTPTPKELAQIKRNPFYFILDNILDTFNIGSLFRLADAVAAQKVFLCGATQTPPSSRIHKSAVGTQNWVPWEHINTAAKAIDQIKKSSPRCQIIAIEQHPKSLPLKSLKTKLPVALVIGHETTGISKAALKKSDKIVEIPMFGVNNSLNVVVAAGIAAYSILTKPTY